MFSEDTVSCVDSWRRQEVHASLKAQLHLTEHIVLQGTCRG